MQRQFTQGLCSEPGCDHLGRITRGLCDTHYSRLIKASGPLPRIPQAERFWSKVDKNGPVPPHRPELGPCWLWTASTQTSGYGQFGLGRGIGVIGAHRMSWILANGAIPDELWVLHECDVKLCVRPDHLFLGTPDDNAADMTTKGRNGFLTKPERVARGERHWMSLYPERLAERRGERNPNAILTEDIVRAIRATFAAGGISKAALGRQYGVTPELIGHVISRRAWKHVI